MINITKIRKKRTIVNTRNAKINIDSTKNTAIVKKRSRFGPDDDYWYQAVTGPTITGVDVDEDNAMKFSTVFACVRVIAETIASLPLKVYEKIESGGKNEVPYHNLYQILHLQPNPLMTSFQYREAAMTHVLLWGNHYSEISRDETGRIGALWPLNPSRMTIKSDESNVIKYEYTPEGKNEPIIFDFEDIFHLPGLGYNGVSGKSPIQYHREAIGLGLASQELASRFFGNDATPPFVLKHPGHLGEKAYETLQKNFQKTYGGLSKKFKFGILPEGMSLEKVGIPLAEAQFLETRRFQREEICGIYRVPPHLVGDLSRSTFSNIEQQSLDFVTNCIRPWLVRFEQALSVKLFSESDRKRYFTEFNVDGLLRGDITSRYAAYALGRNWGWLSADDIREKENLNPLPEGQGKVYLAPLNMVNAKQYTKETAEIPAKIPSEIEQIPKEEPKEEPKEGETK